MAVLVNYMIMAACALSHQNEANTYILEQTALNW